MNTTIEPGHTRIDLSHYRLVRDARERRGLPVATLNRPLKDHPAVGGVVVSRITHERFNVEGVNEQWYLAFYTGFLIERNGSHNFIKWDLEGGWWSRERCKVASVNGDRDQMVPEFIRAQIAHNRDTYYLLTGDRARETISCRLERVYGRVVAKNVYDTFEWFRNVVADAYMIRDSEWVTLDVDNEGRGSIVVTDVTEGEEQVVRVFHFADAEAFHTLVKEKTAKWGISK